jgi:hypothetical protein
MNLNSNNNYMSEEEKPLTHNTRAMDNSPTRASGGVKKSFLFAFIFVVGIGSF